MNLDSVVQIVLPLLLSYITFLYGKNKNKAETKKLEIESEKEEIEVMNSAVDFYKDKMADLLEELEYLKQQVTELKRMVESLVGNQCLGDACPTRIEYNKIMAKRAARKKYNEVKKND